MKVLGFVEPSLSLMFHGPISRDVKTHQIVLKEIKASINQNFLLVELTHTQLWLVQRVCRMEAQLQSDLLDTTKYQTEHKS